MRVVRKKVWILRSHLRKDGRMTDDMPGLFEIIGTTRAMRRLKPDPVPDELIRKILEAGVCAANGSNAQHWRFIVVKDESVKRAVQVWYQKSFDDLVVPHHLNGEPPEGVTPERYKRQFAAVKYLTEHLAEAPVWIVPCLTIREHELLRSSGASIYPAVQNMLLAARALGLGATLTTRHLQHEKESEAALGIPEGSHSYALLPIGYPMGHFGPVGRRSLEDVVYQDRWGTPYDPG
jgi:nitroreductase